MDGTNDSVPTKQGGSSLERLPSTLRGKLSKSILIYGGDGVEVANIDLEETQIGHRIIKRMDEKGVKRTRKDL